MVILETFYYAGTLKLPWTDAERMAVERHFSKFLLFEEGGLPGKYAILRCLDAEPDLSRRAWKNIKDYIRNRKTQLK